jgi:hypothetical protein
MREVRSPELLRLGYKYNLLLNVWYNNQNEKGIRVIPNGYLSTVEQSSLSQAHFFIKEVSDGFKITLFAFKDYSKHLNIFGRKIVRKGKNGLYNPSIYIPVTSESLKKLHHLDACCQWINRFRAMNDSEQDAFISRHSVKFGNDSRPVDLKVIRANYNRLIRDYGKDSYQLMSSLNIAEVEEMKKDLGFLGNLRIEKTVNRAFVTDEKTLRQYREQGVKLDIIPTKVDGSQIERFYQSKNKRNTGSNFRNSPYVGTKFIKETVEFKRLKDGINPTPGTSLQNWKRDSTPLLNSQIEKQSQFYNKYKNEKIEPETDWLSNSR